MSYNPLPDSVEYDAAAYLQHDKRSVQTGADGENTLRVCHCIAQIVSRL